MVTVVDPATQETGRIELPTYFDEEASRPLWKPLWDALHERMRKRGIENAMMLGVMSDGVPTKEQCLFFDEVSGSLPWLSHSHTGFPKVNGKYRIYAVTEIGYQALNRDEIGDAIEIFHYNIDLYPDSANVYDSLGEALERSGRLEHALANYSKAVEHAKQTEDPRVRIFTRNRDRTMERIAATRR